MFLALSGAPLGASSVFVALAAMVLGLTFYLLGRAAVALVREPLTEEVQLATGRRRKELEREKQLLLKALKELEFDHEMGKISDTDFNEIAARYRGRAIQVMRQLDDTSADYRTLVERDLMARKSQVKTADGVPAAPEAPAAATITESPESPKAAAAPVSAPASLGRWQCLSCQTQNDEDALFCKRCGKPAVAAEAT